MLLLRRERLLSLAAIIAALHVAGLSLVLGPTCIPYLAAAYLTAVVVWGGVSISAKKRPMAVIMGAGLTVAVQQAAHQAWKAELGESWWPVAQFFALQLLIGAGVRRAISYALRSRGSDEQEGRGRSKRA